MERKAFDALSAADKFAHIRSGAKISDPVVTDPANNAHRAIRLAYSGQIEAARAAASTRQERYAAFRINEAKARELWPATAADWDRTVSFNRW